MKKKSNKIRTKNKKNNTKLQRKYSKDKGNPKKFKQI